MKYVYVVTGNTESGDKIGPLVFSKGPTDDQLRELAEWFHEEGCENEKETGNCECGPGDYGSYSFFNVDRVVVK